MITREEIKYNLHIEMLKQSFQREGDGMTSILLGNATSTAFNFFEKHIDQLQQHIQSLEAQIKEYEEDFMSQGQIAHRALLIGYEEGWFEWKGDANGGNFSSIENDLKKIRDNTKIYGYVKMMNARTDSLKNKISELEAQLANTEHLTCDNCIQVDCPLYAEAINYSMVDSKHEFYCNKHSMKDTK